MAGNTGNTGNIRESATNLGHRAQETATQAGHRAQEAGSTLAHRAQEAASTAEHRADDALTNVGGTMSSMANQLRHNAPQGGVLGQAAGAVADRLEAGGRYLQENRVRDMAEDMTDVMRRYPVASLCVGFGFGFLFGMAFTRR